MDDEIYTLAQSGTKNYTEHSIILIGKGSDITNNKTAKSKAQKKIITQTMALSLVDVSKENRVYECRQSYWNTYHCQNRITTSDGKIYGRYCKNRICTICSNIRKAELINKYYPVIKTWEDPHFVTLTAKACSKRVLKRRIDKTIEAFKIINQRLRKRHQRGKGIKIMGIRSLECNYNPEKKTYNPHFHLIVPNKETGEAIVKEWLNLWTYKYARKYAQKNERCYSVESTLIEVIKYGSKIFTEPDLKQKSKGLGTKIYAGALHNILNAMKGHRIFDRFGFNLPKTSETSLSKVQTVIDYDKWVYIPKLRDWRNVNSDEVLSKYVAPPKLQYLLEQCIDKEAC